MKKIIAAVALAIAIPAATYAQIASPPSAKPAQTDRMQDHAECMKMHGMMVSMMHGSDAQRGRSMMHGGAHGQGHQQVRTPDGKAPAADQHQQHQQ